MVGGYCHELPLFYGFGADSLENTIQEIYGNLKALFSSRGGHSFHLHNPSTSNHSGHLQGGMHGGVFHIGLNIFFSVFFF